MPGLMLRHRLAGSMAAALLLAAPLVVANESARRDYFEPEGRAQKFQRAEQIFPTRRVQAGRVPWTLPSAASRLPAGFSYEWNGAEHDVDDFNERTRGSALLVIADGQIVHEWYGNGALPSTRFISFSTGKSVTSTLVGLALGDGLIESLDDPLTRYLPALTGTAYEGVSIRQALRMTSGVQWNEEAYDWSDTSVPLVRHWLGAYVEQRYRLVEGASGLPRAHPPGERFNYNTLETSILGWLVENVSRQRLATFMAERLWQPAGMESDAAWILDGPEAVGREMTGGGLLATLRDFGRFGLLMANDGVVEGRRVLPEGWVAEATRPGSEAVAYGRLYEDYPLGYGYQWWLLPNGRFEAQGVYGQLIYVAPVEGVVIVKLSHWPEAWVPALELESYAFFDAVVAAVGKQGTGDGSDDGEQ